MVRIAFLAAMLMLADPVTTQTTTVVGVPSTMLETTSTAVLEAAMTLIKASKIGDKIAIFDARTQQTIATLRIPSGVYRARLRKLSKEIGKLRRFLKRPASTRQADREEIRWPQFFSTVAASVRHGAGKTRVLLYGQPAYLDARDKAQNYGRGTVPNDAFISAPSSKSVFGTADKRGTLTEVVVHFCYGTDRFQSELERRASMRFIALACKEMGATLSTFEVSSEVTLERMTEGASDPVLPDLELNRDETEFVMIHYVGKTVEKTRADEKKQKSEIRTPAPQTTVGPKTLKQKPAIKQALEAGAAKVSKPKIGFLRVAAVWVSDGKGADVDLYLRPSPTAGELYFSNKETAEGHYLRDQQSSHPDLGDGNWKAAWEVIEVRKGNLGSASCWLNLFKNSKVSKVEGLVRFQFADQMVDMPFSFAGGEGDSAKGRDQRDGDPNWIRVSVPRMQPQKAGR